jgi:hypothetical protein
MGLEFGALQLAWFELLSWLRVSFGRNLKKESLINVFIHFLVVCLFM